MIQICKITIFFMSKLILWTWFASFLFWVLFLYVAQSIFLPEKNITVTRDPWNYTFINPLLECDGMDTDKDFFPLEKSIISRVDKEIISKNPSLHLSLYFRDLQNGPWFWINEKEEFAPASLLKLPLLIWYLFAEDSTPWLIHSKLKIQSFDTIKQNIISHVDPLEPWKEYEILEILRYMIAYSDNLAAENLLENVPAEYIDVIYKKFWITFDQDILSWGEDIISVKQYASFFRILYNASFLSRNSSELALALLAQSTFKKWIVAGIPTNIIVAHKFWERVIPYTDGTQTLQLHDCGIVYTQNPYLLCIMTKADNAEFDFLQTVITQASKIVFDEVNRKN